MYTYEVKGNVVQIKLKTYDGDIVEHSVVKESGSYLQVGGTASNWITIKRGIVLGTYVDDIDKKRYGDVSVEGQAPIRMRICGPVYDGGFVHILETLDMDEKVRFIAMVQLPTDYRRHFINFDIISVKSDRIVRRLRIDPYFGGAKVVF